MGTVAEDNADHVTVIGSAALVGTAIGLEHYSLVPWQLLRWNSRMQAPFPYTVLTRWLKFKSSPLLQVAAMSEFL